MFYARHGDVGLHTQNELPKEVKKLKTKDLWYGETGHTHRFTTESDVTIYEGEGPLTGTRFFVVGEKGATITHEEHKPIQFVPGVYKTIIERERDPFTAAIRQVID